MKAVGAAGGGARATGFTCPWGGHLVRCSADASIGRYRDTSTMGMAAALLPRVSRGSKLPHSGGSQRVPRTQAFPNPLVTSADGSRKRVAGR